MKKKSKMLLKLAKQVVDKKIYKTLKKIKEEDELENASKYSIVSAIENKYDSLDYFVDIMKSRKKDFFFAKNKLLLIPSKIKHFKVDYSEREFYKLLKLLNEAEEEIKCLIH